MTTSQSTPESRVLRVQNTTRIARLTFHGERVIILNPTICYPGRTYRLELDSESRTGWIYHEGRAS